MINKIQLLVLVIASAALTFSSCKKTDESTAPPKSSKLALDLSENGTNPDEAIFNGLKTKSLLEAYLYTESNAAAKNEILCYKQHSDGSLTLQATVASGGTGAGAGLGSQGALALDRIHDYLFAVNAGDNTVSSFKIATDGSLTLAKTIGTNGTKPVSLTYHKKLLYVVNAASDNISGFRVGAMGELTFIEGSIRSLSGMGTGPAQIAFSPNGKYLYVSEKATNKMTTFPVDSMGVAGVGTSISSTGVTPFGFSFSRNKYLVISNAAGGATGASTCTSYSGINEGWLSPVNGEVANHQSASCWVATAQFGRFAYISNAASDDISSYYVSPSGGLFLLEASAALAGSHPTEICVAKNNFYVYNINAASHSISGYHRLLHGGLVAIGTTTGLPDFSSGLVSSGH